MTAPTTEAESTSSSTTEPEATSTLPPTEEEIVVQGFISEGAAADTIWITRTLPPLEA